MPFSVAQRTQIVLIFLACQRHFREFRNRWSLAFPTLPVPVKSTVYKLLRKFTNLGNVADAPRSGRRKSARSQANIAAVEQTFHVLAQQNEEDWGIVGIRDVARQLGISTTSVWRISRFDLQWKGYKPRPVQTLLEEDFPRRVLFANQILNRLKEEENFIDYIIWSDESTFTCRGFVST